MSHFLLKCGFGDGLWIEHQAELAQVLDRALRRTTEAKFITVDAYLPTIVNMAIDEHPAHRNTQEIDLNKIELILTLKKDEDRVGGEENLKRLKKTGKHLLDARVMEELLKRPELIPEEWKKYNTIYFWGTIFRRADGSRFVCCLGWDGCAWGWCCIWLGSIWSSDRPTASLASSP